MDRDNNAATGCTVNTASGPFGGVEQIFTTTVNTAVSPAVVSGVTRRDCVTPPSTYTAPVAVDEGGWPVGVGNGTGGFDVLESYVTVSQQFGEARLGFVYTNPGSGSDVLFTANGQAGGPPILVQLGPAPAIPTLTHGALLLLAFGLGWFALRRLRQHTVSTLVMVGVLASSVAGAAPAAVILDGLINDWAGVPPVATDPIGDAAAGSDIAAAFVQVAAGRVYTRLDVKITAPAPKAPTTTAVTSSVNPSVSGQGVTFTATVTTTPPGTGTATGTVQFKDGAALLGAPVTLDGTGNATFSTSTLAPGPHAITAEYAGDGTHNASSGSLPTQTVNKANSATALTSSANPSTAGSSVTFSASLSAVAPGAGTPTGTVSFFDGAALLGTSPLAAGVAQFSTSSLTPGSHPNVNTTYAGDAGFNGSTGGPLDQVVNAVPVAVADGYSTLHDTLLAAAAPGVLGNDTLGTPAATIDTVQTTTCAAFPCVRTTAQSGSVSVNADGTFSYTPPALFSGNDAFTYTITSIAGSSSATVTIGVQDAAPVIDLDGALSAGIDFGPVPFTEGGPAVAIVGTTPPNALTITDGDSADLGSATITLTNVQDTGVETLALTCPGVLPACSGAILAADIVPSSTPTKFTLTITRVAPPADYQALLRSLTYHNGSPNPTPGTHRLITIRVDDRIKDNTPLAQSTVQVVGVNNAPTITAPAAAVTPKNTNLAFTGGNAVSVADADAGGAFVKVTLTATNGSMSMTGLGTSTAFLLNAAIATHNGNLATLQFIPDAGYAGPASVKIDIDDLGNTGTGGPLTATRTVDITVDPPATVISSDPAHNDDHVPTNKIITFTFSEPVNVNPNSFSLECPAGIPKPYSVAPVGPAAVYTLTPTTPLSEGAICTVAAFNNQITDSVGQNLAASHVASFRVNTLPTVQSTVPTDMAVDVPTSSTITIFFTESVNAGAGAFTLECPAATPIAFGVNPPLPATTSAFVLTPGAGLPSGTVCVVKVVAAQVQDQSLQNMAVDDAFTFTTF